ncbi:unnamed protein product [Mesocestoides corti]|uniref:SART-1 family protein n=1 Tax=Mesocestoides corti TaxID=53468 RepID=A0A0R3UH34_MESCO|nr:unnamed protein product [Mesocestoides corti]
MISKLRAKLGLAPLDVGNQATRTESDDNKPRNSDTDFVHLPAKDITKAKQTEKLQEKIVTSKEKRELLNKLREYKSLGADEDVSVSSWVEKMRTKEKAKLEADKREKILAEMDEEFGVSAIVAERIKPTVAKQEYSSASLEGLKVEHDVNTFSEGAPIILTLKDSDVLAEDPSDVLINVNLADDEKAAKNRENKRKLAGLGGIVQDEDEDVLMGLREKGILEKYDVEIDGPKKAKFTLEAGGTYAPGQELAMRRLEEELRANRESIGDQELRPAAEFYTPGEMAQFKKKKKRKVQRRILRADDLIPDAASGPQGVTPSVSADHGSRSRRTAKPAQNDVTEEGEVEDSKDVKKRERNEESQKKDVKSFRLSSLTGLNPEIAALLSVQTIAEEDGQLGDDEDADDQWIAEPLEPDDLQLELEKTLSLARNANLSKPIPPEERLQMIVAEGESVVPKPEAPGPNTGGLVFDATAEFFKQISGGLQSDLNAKLVKKEEEGNGVEQVVDGKERSHRDESSRHSSSKSSSSSRRHHDDKATSSKSSSRRRYKEEGDVAPSSSSFAAPTATEEGAGVFEEEPALNQGVFSALLLAQKKGYVETQKEKERPMGQLVNLMAKHYVEEDIRYDDIDAKFAKRERYNGPLSDFREKSNYKPDVKLYYVDEMGRNMTPKEAFRQLSHKFHGKGSGKKKTEKRTKKIIEEALIKNSASSDTPLGTLNKLNKKLERQGMPYVVLSGKGSITVAEMRHRGVLAASAIV